jgi:uncharacterized protein YjbI with pentapeptide repeats
MKKQMLSIFLAFLIYTALLSYLSLSVIRISDLQVAITKTVILPILNIEIGLNAFFMTASLSALFFCIWLQHLLYKKRVFFNDSRSGMLKSSYTIRAASVFGGMLSLFMMITAFKYVKTHEPVLSYFFATAPILGVFIVTRSLKKLDSSVQKRPFKKMSLLFVLSVAAIVLFLVLLLIPSAKRGSFPQKINLYVGRYLDPFVFVNLNHQKLSSESTEAQKNTFQENCEGIHLEGAYLRYAILKKAHFKDAFLQKAKMQFAELEGADLSFANLMQVNFWNADLKGADLSQAYLLGAYFREALAQGAILRDSNLQYVNFFLADFREADFSFADLRLAYLWTANFKGANFFKANLQGISLRMSNFTEADLRNANLQKVNLWKAELKGADLMGADLRGAEDLELEQLAEAKTLYDARLDPALRKQIEEKYPHLLKKPKEKK